MSEPKQKLIRPVKCHFCNQPMFYAGDERHEPEVDVSIRTVSTDYDQQPNYKFYAHVRCWNERFAANNSDVIDNAIKQKEHS